MPVTVKDVLAAPVLCDAHILGGSSGVEEREVRWTTVIEWRGADFVRPGELILTTGLGCDAQRFERFTRQLADGGAAALCVSLHEKGELTDVPEGVRRFADEQRFPVISVPWAVRFSEIMMGIIDRLIEQQYAAVLGEPDRLLGSFTSALLGGTGLAAIAEALAGIIQRPVLILNSEFYCVAHSAQARAALGPALERWSDAAAALNEHDLRELRRVLGGDSARRVEAVEQFGLGPGLVTAAIARQRPVGYVYVPRSDDLPLIPTLEKRALSHAAIAVAMEMLRLRAAAEAESRVRGNFVWSLVAGIAGPPSEVATNAVLLGYDLRAEYEVAVGVGGGRDPDARIAHAEQLALGLEGTRSLNPIVARQSDQILFLLRGGGPRPARKVLEPLLDGGSSSWGIADGAFALLDIGRGYRQAMQALEIGTIVHGAGHLTDARSLGPYLMLDVLAHNEPAVQSARGVLEPILEYDRGTGRDLLSTLEIYLRENGNTSAAARALYLNRHSLRYRLHKIEQLTGRSLEEYQDRFMLDLSVKLLRLVERHESRPITTAEDGS